MKRKILTVLAILLGLAGLGVLLYPSVSNVFNISVSWVFTDDKRKNTVGIE